MESLQQCYYHDHKTGQFRSSGQAGKGVTNADFILYVAALSSVKCQHAKTIAYAAHCQQEIVLDRYILHLHLIRIFLSLLFKKLKFISRIFRVTCMLHSFRNDIILQLIHLLTCLCCKCCNNRECVVTQICVFISDLLQAISVFVQILCQLVHMM